MGACKHHVVPAQGKGRQQQKHQALLHIRKADTALSRRVIDSCLHFLHREKPPTASQHQSQPWPSSQDKRWPWQKPQMSIQPPAHRYRLTMTPLDVCNSGANGDFTEPFHTTAHFGAVLKYGWTEHIHHSLPHNCSIPFELPPAQGSQHSHSCWWCLSYTEGPGLGTAGTAGIHRNKAPKLSINPTDPTCLLLKAVKQTPQPPKLSSQILPALLFSFSTWLNLNFLHQE